MLENVDSDRIAPTFDGQHVFITGSTGFMGKMFLERLLSLTSVAKIYLLLRQKRNSSPEQRLSDLFECALFDSIKLKMSLLEILEKIHVVSGDCEMINLGIDESTRRLICENVTFIYHFAATVRFDEPLRKAVNLNLNATYQVIKLAKKCEKLRMLCHISTAFCHLDEQHLHEKFYKPPVNPHDMLKILDKDDSDEELLLEKICTSNAFPNTYVLTKNLAEAIMYEAKVEDKLPVVVIRPSIVTPSIYFPMPGWVNGYNGLGGLLVAIGKGVIRTAYCDEKLHGDFIPVDITAHAIMIATWNFFHDSSASMINLTTSHEITMCWGEIVRKGLKLMIEKYPMKQVLWYPRISLTKYRMLHKIKAVFYHWLPAIVVDSVLFCIRMKPFLFNVHDRIAKGIKTLDVFTNNQWTFENAVMLTVQSKLNKCEVKKYRVTVDGVDVDKYIDDCVVGGQRYLLKQRDPNDYVKGRRLLKIMYYLDALIKLVVICGIIFLAFSLVMKLSRQ